MLSSLVKSRAMYPDGMDLFWSCLLLCCVFSLTAADPDLLYLDRNSIRSYDLETREETVVVPTRFVNGIAMDFDIGRRKLYVSDVLLKQLYTVDLSVDPPSVETLLADGLDVPDGLAVDWVNNRLYWTDTGQQILILFSPRQTFL